MFKTASLKDELRSHFLLSQEVITSKCTSYLGYISDFHLPVCCITTHGCQRGIWNSPLPTLNSWFQPPLHTNSFQVVYFPVNCNSLLPGVEAKILVLSLIHLILFYPQLISQQILLLLPLKYMEIQLLLPTSTITTLVQATIISSLEEWHVLLGSLPMSIHTTA